MADIPNTQAHRVLATIAVNSPADHALLYPKMKYAIHLVLGMLVLSSSISAQEFTVRPVPHDVAAPAASVAAPVAKAIAPRQKKPAVASPVTLSTHASSGPKRQAPTVPASTVTRSSAVSALRDTAPPKAVSHANGVAAAPVPASPRRADEPAPPVDNVAVAAPKPTLVVAALPLSTVAVDSVAAPAKKVARSDSASLPKAPPAPLPMTLNLGTVVFGGIVQTTYQAGSSDAINTFRLRRAEMKFVGTVSPTVKWQVMLDLAKTLKVASGTPNQSTLPLQDAFMSLKMSHVDVQAGQFVLPLTYEGTNIPSSGIEAADRSLMVTDGKLGMVRDIGVQFSTKFAVPVRARIGLFNSTGDLQNGTASVGAKAIVGRVDMSTPITGLTLGSSGASAGRDPAGNASHDRIGADVEYAHSALGARSEFMRAWDGTDVRFGSYTLVTYTVGTLQWLVRHDYWDKNTGVGAARTDVLERDITAGFAWYIESSNVVLRTNYVRRTVTPVPQRDQLIMLLQAAW